MRPADPRMGQSLPAGAGALLAATIGLLAACASIPVLPDSMPACPPEALAATKRLAIPATAYFEARSTGGAARVAADRHNLVVALRDGPIEAKVSKEARALISWQELETASCNVPVDPNELVGPVSRGITRKT